MRSFFHHHRFRTKDVLNLSGIVIFTVIFYAAIFSNHSHPKHSAGGGKIEVNSRSDDIFGDSSRAFAQMLLQKQYKESSPGEEETEEPSEVYSPIMQRRNSGEELESKDFFNLNSEPAAAAVAVAAVEDENEEISEDDEPEDGEREKCSQPKTKIGFLKTHKTASSTIQNIIFRYGIRNELNFVFPKSGHELGEPPHPSRLTDPFQVSWLNKVTWHKKLLKSGGYDIVALHAKWNYDAYRELLGENATFITILRNPVDAFESLYSYGRFERVTGLSLQNYIKQIKKNEFLQKTRMDMSMGLNQQSWDLGLGSRDLQNSTIVDEHIKILEDQFHLVMISERFDESIVLLADLLCIPLKELVSLKVNARMAGEKNTLSDKERRILSDVQEPDVKLYERFVEILDERVREYGEDRMREDLIRLKEFNEEFYGDCVEAEVDPRDPRIEGTEFEPANGKIVAFKLKNQESPDPDCKWAAIAEDDLVALTRNIQKSRLKRLDMMY